MATEGDVKTTLDTLVRLRTGVEPQSIGAGQRLTSAAKRELRAAPGWASAESVVAFGLGEKTTLGREIAEVALKVYVDKKKPLSALDAPVPKTVALGGAAPVPTDVVEIGRVEIQSNTGKVRPALPGFSISRLGDDPNTGTFGLIVRKKGQPKPYYLLSNNHAIAASGLAQKGDVIIQPGAYDGGQATDRIGTLVEWVPFDFSASGPPNVVDAAIAQLDDDVASAAICLLGVPTGVNTEVKRGTFVQKMGRTTELSVAQVRDVDLFLPVPYPAAGGGTQMARLSDQVLVTFYSAGGDSGSGVLDMDRKVVGLHVGGSPIIGFFSKITNIMDKLGVEVVTDETTASSPAVA